MPAADLFPYLRDVPDFPQPGIMFKDITPLLADPKAFGRAVDGMCEGIKASGAQNIIAIESRGFILAAGAQAGEIAASDTQRVLPVGIRHRFTGNA